MDQILDEIFEEIESDITSVWSSNESEQWSQQVSAQLSADAKAAGMTTMSADTPTISLHKSKTDSDSDTNSVTSTSSSDSSADSTVSDDHSHSHHGYGYHDSSHVKESSHSGTYWSLNESGDTNGSFSHGTSNRTGEASTVSTVSIKLKPFKEFYANDVHDQMVEILDDPNKADSVINHNFNGIGGVKWTGDADNEYIFGTSWLDKLYGGAGGDVIYGFENNDVIYGEGGRDRLFGDGGDDLIKTGSG
jgi:Ca2+-binding RTX toxin-like protein